MKKESKILLSTTLLIASSTLYAEEWKDSISEMTPIVVTGTRNATDSRHLPMNVTVVDREQLTQNQQPNVLPTLTELVPGLLTTGRGMMGYGVSGGAAGNISIRGISSGMGRVMVLIDGLPQYNGVYGHSISDSYQTMMTERVEVLRGPASVLYGSNAMGGVINIVTRKAQQDGTQTHINLGAGSYGTVQAEASNQTKKGRFSSTVAAQFGRSDNHRPDMGFRQYGGFVKLGYELSQHWNFYADADVTHFDASWPGTTSQPMIEADQWITRGVVNMGIENRYEKTNGRISVYDNFGRHKINDGYEANGGTSQNRLFRSKDALAGISWYQNANLWAGGQITAGADYQHIYGKAYYTDRKTGEVLNTPNKQSGTSNNDEVGIYIDAKQEATEWLTLNAGLRYDYHTETGGEWIPQGGIVLTPCKTGEVKAMVSKGFRNPTMKELYLYPPSNENLRPEKLINYELSWQQRLTDVDISYSLNLFHIHAENIIQTINRKNINTGELRNSGVEMAMDWTVSSHWSVNTNHSYLYMKKAVVSAPTYKGYIGFKMNYGKWNATAGIQELAALYTSVGANETKENFTLLNATVNYQLIPAVRLWVRGENLLAQRYEYILDTPMPKATFMAGVNVRL